MKLLKFIKKDWLGKNRISEYYIPIIDKIVNIQETEEEYDWER